jgi:hypothetical protein
MPKKKSIDKTAEPVQYEVQKVVGAKFKSKCPNIRKTASDYKIRWVGFSAKWDTYEPAENIEACATESVDSFWEERDIAKTKIESEKVVKTGAVTGTIAKITRPRRSTASKKPTETAVTKITEKLESTSIQKRGNKRGSLFNSDTKSPSPKKVKTAIEKVEAKVLEIMSDTVKHVGGQKVAVLFDKRSSRRAKSENIGLAKSGDGDFAHISPKKATSKGVSSKGTTSRRVATNKAKAIDEKKLENKKKSETKKIPKTKSGLPVAFQKKSAVKKIKTKIPAKKRISKSGNTEINEFKKSQILKVVKQVLKKESYMILESVKQHVDKQMDRFQQSQEDFYTEIKTLILSCESELSDELRIEISQVEPDSEIVENKSDEDSALRNDSEIIEAPILLDLPILGAPNSSETENNPNEENIDPMKMTKPQQIEFLKSQAELVEKRKSGDE